ncbi:MAG: hypothetical protein ACOVO1_05985 [Chitinophagaceae bacterium]
MNVAYKPQGQMEFQQVFFYTDTINDFSHLLATDELKMMVINSWQYFVANKLVNIYAYVIMPNHIHLLWNIL